MTAIANTVAGIWREAQIIAKGSAESGEIVEALGRLSAEASRQREGWAGVAAELSQRIRPLLHEPVFTLSRSGSVEYALIAAAREQASAGADGGHHCGVTAWRRRSRTGAISGRSWGAGFHRHR